MARLCYLLIEMLLTFLFIVPSMESVRHGFPPDLLHVEHDKLTDKHVRMINADNANDLHQFVRSKRSVDTKGLSAKSKSRPLLKSSDQKNITTMVSRCARISYFFLASRS